MLYWEKVFSFKTSSLFSISSFHNFSEISSLLILSKKLLNSKYRNFILFYHHVFTSYNLRSSNHGLLAYFIGTHLFFFLTKHIKRNSLHISKQHCALIMVGLTLIFNFSVVGSFLIIFGLQAFLNTYNLGFPRIEKKDFEICKFSGRIRKSKLWFSLIHRGILDLRAVSPLGLANTKYDLRICC